MKPTCLAFDLDYTLIRFTAGYGGLFQIFTDQGVSLSKVKASYESAKKSPGFSVGNLLMELVENTDVVIDAERVYADFDAWLRDSLQRYPDAKPLTKDIATPVAIVTLGDPAYQKQKTLLAGIRFNAFKPVTKPDGKPEALQELIKKFGEPIFYVDDKASELDRIRDSGLSESEVKTFRILRDESPYLFEKARYGHESIGSLKQLLS